MSVESIMRQLRAGIQHLWPGRRHPAVVSGASMFARLRTQLTLWYSGVLAGMLILFGVLLYLGTQQMLFGAVNDGLAGAAAQVKMKWQFFCLGPPQGSTPGTLSSSTRIGVLPAPGPVHYITLSLSPNDPSPPILIQGQEVLVACFDTSAVPLPGAQYALPAGASDPFITNDTLARTTLQQGTPQTDIIDEGGSFGQVYRYAEVIQDPGGRIIGVVQVGQSVETQERVLRFLLILLLSLGGAAVLGAIGGGLWLAERALAPARLAFARQQAFIGDASHELRTPLTLLRTDAEVLLRGRERLDPDDVVLLEDIVAEAGHMAWLADTMLLLARLDADHVHLEREVVDLASVMTQTVQRAQPLAKEKQVTLLVERADETLVIGDRVLLEQATLILLDNAIKYNRAGGRVALRAWVAGKHAFLEVSDTGIGIAPEHLPRLGERFYRVDKARSREAGGAGLGLSIARRIATTHQGDLALSSVAGQGTTARLSLPAAIAPGHAPLPRSAR
jgi:signal transduction histidine kinase